MVATIRIPYGVVMAFGLGTLWVAQDAPTVMSGGGEQATVRPGKLYRIDPTSNRIMGRPVPLPGLALSPLAAGEGAVCIGEQTGEPSPGSTWFLNAPLSRAAAVAARTPRGTRATAFPSILGAGSYPATGR